MQKFVLTVSLLSLGFLAQNAQATPALDGNCVVCLYNAGQLVPGKKEFSHTYDGLTYQFPSQKELSIFQANPAKYVPALAGDCTVCFSRMGVRVPGKAQFWTKYNDRLYLFPSQKELNLFEANPQEFAMVDVAFQCYCPVCLLDMEKLIPGKQEFVSIYDGMRYYFPGEEVKRKFDAHPVKYAPALGGNCVVCLKDGGKHVRGKLQFGAFYDGRSYLFPENGARKKFMANPERYAHVDLANNGNCIVCQAMMGKSMPGSPLYRSMYKGKVYRFPGAKQKQMFDADPHKFLSATNQKPTAANPIQVLPQVGQDAKFRTLESHPPKVKKPVPKNLISVTGTTACAGCEFGKRPLTNPGSLGLAVVAANKKIYIIEGAEKRYPQVYENRFSGLRVQVQGTVRQRQGNFVWLNPTSLRKGQ